MNLLGLEPTTTAVYIVAAIVGSVAAIGAIIIRFAPRGEAAIDVATEAASSWKSLFEAEVEKAKDVRADLARERDARSSIDEALETAKETITQLREKVAGLEARPDTERMLHVFEAHHSDNQNMMRALLDNQAAGLDELKKVGEGLTVLLTRAEKFRQSDERTPS